MSYYQSSRYYDGVTLVTQLVYAMVSKDSTDTTGRMYVLDPYGSSTQLLRADTQFEAELTTGVKDHQDSLYMSSPKTWLFKSAS